MSMLLHARRFDLDVDCDCLADSRNRFRALARHQLEIAPLERLSCHRPARFFRIARDRAQQLHVQCDRFRDAVHRKIAKDIAALLTGLSHLVASECHFRKLYDVEKFRTAQMVVPFHDSGVDAANVDFCRH
jgi:hypothetical protein